LDIHGHFVKYSVVNVITEQPVKQVAKPSAIKPTSCKQAAKAPAVEESSDEEDSDEHDSDEDGVVVT
jgi:hypothetical protein